MKKITKLFLLSTVAATLAACGNRAPVKIPEVNVLTMDELKTGGDIEISLWHGFGAGPTPPLQAAIKDFEKKYDFIKVKEETKGGYPNLKKAVSLEIATGNTPNVVLGYPDHFAEYLFGEIVLPLNKYIEAKEEEVGIKDMNDFFENYMTENKQFVDGYVFGLPFNKSTEVMVYNKTFFDAYKDNSKIFVPKTWDEVNSVGKEILSVVKPLLGKKDQKSGLDFTNVKEADFYPMSYDSQANFFITLARQWGGEYTSKGADFTEGKIKFDNPKTREALEFIKTMYTDHVFAPPAQWEEAQYASNPFKALKTLIGVGSSAGVYNNLPATAGAYELGIAPIPYKTADKAAVIQQGTNLAVLANATDRQRQASWLLVKHLTSSEANTKFAVATSYLPVRKSGVDSADYQAFIDSTPSNTKDKSIAETAKVAFEYSKESNPVKWLAFTDPGFIGSSEIRSEAEKVIPSITKAGKSIEDAIKEAKAQLPSYTD